MAAMQTLRSVRMPYSLRSLNSSALPRSAFAIGAVPGYQRHASLTAPTSLRVGGVPEHFNGPLHWARADGGAYSKAVPSFKVDWTYYPKGTGEMVAAVEAGEVDVAVLLLEGGVAAIAKGSPIRIFGTYVSTPLSWGVHVKADAPLDTIDDLRGKVFGVSRMGSGSHLMAQVMASQRGWSMEDVKLKVTGSLDDARDSMHRGEIDAWLWEKFTTNFLVEQNEWKRVGEVPTPWPCFVMVATEKTCKDRPADLRRLLELTQPVCREYKNNVGGKTVKYVSENHRLSPALASEWLAGVDWACDAHVPPEALAEAVGFLQRTGQIDKVPEELVASLTGLQVDSDWAPSAGALRNRQARNPYLRDPCASGLTYASSQIRALKTFKKSESKRV